MHFLEKFYFNTAKRRKNVESHPRSQSNDMAEKWYEAQAAMGEGGWKKEKAEWNENDGINVKSPHYIDGFYSHSFFVLLELITAQ